MLRFRPEVLPFLLAALVAGGVLAIVIRLAGGSTPSLAGWGGGTALVLAVYFLYFFRDPVRTAPADPAAIVSALSLIHI